MSKDREAPDTDTGAGAGGDAAAAADKTYRKAVAADLEKENIEFFGSDDGIKPIDPIAPLTPPPTKEQLETPDSKYLVEDKPPIPSSNDTDAGAAADATKTKTAAAAARIVFSTTKLTPEEEKETLKKLLSDLESTSPDESTSLDTAATVVDDADKKGGRRHTKRKGRKGSKKSKKGAKKSKKGAKQSQKGGRHSSKNRRKQSRRRKH